MVMTNRSAADEHNRNVVEQYEIPVVQTRDSSYKNAIIIRELNDAINRNDLLNELVAALKFNDQLTNVFGLFFLHEKGSSRNSLSVVFLLRNVKKFFDILGKSENKNDELFFIRIHGSLKEVLDIKCTNYSLVYMKNDQNCKSKSLAFSNVTNMSLHSTWNLFGDQLTAESDEVVSIIITKDRIFVNCKSEICSLRLQRLLLLNYGTDFDLIDCSEKLVLLRNNYNSSVGVLCSNDIKVVINL